MDQCNDKKFENRLYAYEIGLLSEEENREMELHLMTCNSCFEKIHKFVKPAELIRHDSEVQSAIIAMDETDALTFQKTFKQSFLPKFIPTALLTALILFMLIVKPWQIEIKSFQEAIASDNRLAVVYFENLTEDRDTENIGEVMTNLLITDLSSSDFMQIVSSQQVYDILKQLGEDSARYPYKEFARDIAQKADARWMLTGTIIQNFPSPIITAHITDVRDGSLFKTISIEGSPHETIYTIVDSLTSRIKQSLELPIDVMFEPDLPVARATTSSPKAYANFIEGIKLYSRYYYFSAGDYFERALEYDSTMAMAYYYLSYLNISQNSLELIEKAVRYSEGLGNIDKLYILAQQAKLKGDLDLSRKYLDEIIEQRPQEKWAYYLVGQVLSSYHEKEKTLETIKYLNRAIEIDPYFKDAYNFLAYTYNNIKEFEKSINALNKYIELMPDEPNPYDSRGEIYAVNGEKEKAVESFRKALAIDPDFSNSLLYIGMLSTFLGEYDRADSCFNALIDNDNETIKTFGIAYRIFPYIYRGQYTKALALIDENRKSEDHPFIRHFHLYQEALIYKERGEYHKAITYFDSVLQTMPNENISNHKVFCIMQCENYIALGDLEGARKVAESLKSFLDSINGGESYYYLANGLIEMAKGNTSKAVEDIKKTTDVESEIFTYYHMARAYLANNNLGKAIKIFSALSKRASQAEYVFINQCPMYYYYLGIAYEKSNWKDEAIKAYETYLDIMKESDPGLLKVEEVRARLNRLSPPS